MTDRTKPDVADRRKAMMRFLPFADVASDALPLSRLLRLSMFQLSVGMAAVLLTGTLNRVMIVELDVPAWIVSLMVALPLVFAPFRALIGHRSDRHVSAFGWRRGPYIWFGSLFQFGGLAIMPFALLVLAGLGTGHEWFGYICAAVAFLLVGAGMHIVQTAGLALATDISPPGMRPRVVALLYIMLLLGMVISSLIFGLLLTGFSQLKLIQLIQGAAVVTMVLNTVALWKQEGRNRPRNDDTRDMRDFKTAWAAFTNQPGVMRLLVATGLGVGAFSMQDILLEPYGGEVLGMTVSGTTMLTAVFATGSIIGFAWPARFLAKNAEPHRVASLGALIGVLGFSLLVLSNIFVSQAMFVLGVALVGTGGGFFSVCTLIAVMTKAEASDNGIALGIWGAVHATCTGVAVGLGGAGRDFITWLSAKGALGTALADASASYSFIYAFEVVLLFVALAVIGPLANHSRNPNSLKVERLEIQAFPN